MRTIHKFAVPVVDELTVEMPLGAKVLCVALQAGVPCIWALVNDEMPLVPCEFRWRGTGHDCAGLGSEQYVGTIHALGPLVFHLFQEL